MMTRYCFYCGLKLSRRTITSDHVVPRSKGGKDDASNIVDCCKGCNGAKGSLSANEYRVVLAYRKGLIKEPLAFRFYGEADGKLIHPDAPDKRSKPKLEISMTVKNEAE